jgi:hypothetical protein
MDTKLTLERACRRLESRYRVPEEFKERIRRILEPLFRHVLDADEMVAVERALERTYMRHAMAETPATPASVAEQIIAEGADAVRPLQGAAGSPAAAAPSGPPPTPSADAPAAAAPSASMTTDGAAPDASSAAAAVPASGGRKGGLLLVKVDPKTKTAQLIRLSAEEVKVLAEHAALGDFLKSSDPDDGGVVH